jgi:GNAT superfamily N-acetyltransferase
LSRELVIRPAEPGDIGLLFSLIAELAKYERAAGRVAGTEELLREALFGERPVAEAVIAEVDAAPAGFALFFTTFSTWLCRPGIWLEDLYVRPESRRGGVGRAMLGHLAQLAVQRGCGRLEWSALDWNSPALTFYDSLGAQRLSDWEGFRLEGAALGDLAAEPRADDGPRNAVQI